MKNVFFNHWVKSGAAVALVPAILFSSCSQSGSSPSGTSAGSNGPGNSNPVAQTQDMNQTLRSKAVSGDLSLFTTEALVPGLKNELKKKGISPVRSGVDLNSSDSKKSLRRIRTSLRGNTEKQLSLDTGISQNQPLLIMTLPFGGPGDVNTIDASFVQGLKLDAQDQLKKIYDILDSNAADAADMIAQVNLQNASSDTQAKIKQAQSLPEPQRSQQLKSLISSTGLDKPDPKQNIDDSRMDVAKQYINASVLKILGSNSGAGKVAIEGAAIANAYVQLKSTITAFQSFRQQLQTTLGDFKTAGTKVHDAIGEVKQMLDADHNADDYKKTLSSVKDALSGSGGDAAVASAAQSIQGLKDAAQKLSDTTSALASSATLLLKAAKVLGVSQSVIDKGTAVVNAVNVGDKVLSAFAKGGVTGAIEAAAELGGLFQDDSQKEILDKLDDLAAGQQQIMVMQQETLKLQMATLQAVVDLSQMIDDNQQVLLATLSGIEGELQHVDASVQDILEKQYFGCDLFIYGRHSERPDERLLAMTKGSEKFLSDYNLITAKLGDSELKGEYQACYQGIRYLYQDESNLTNVLAIRLGKTQQDSSGDGLAQNTAQLQILKSMSAFMGTRYGIATETAFASGMHLPSSSLSMVSRKYSQVNDDSGGNTYLLSNNFLSTPDVIQETKILLSMAPVLSVLGRSGDWTQGGFANIPSDSDLKAVMKQSLRLVESDIAQESLISGEPILGFLYESLGRGELKSNDCKGQDALPMSCVMQKNPFLSQNFLNYFIQRKLIEAHKKRDPKFQEDFFGAPDAAVYDLMYTELSNADNPDTSILTNTFGADFVQNNIVVDGGMRKFNIGGMVLVPPTPDDYEKDAIVYRPFMTDLIKLERTLAEKVSKQDSTGLNPSDTQLLMDYELSNGSTIP